MKISEQLTQARDALAAWAQPLGGTAEVAGDPVHLFAILGAKPGAVRVAIILESEDKRGEYEESGEVDRTFLAVISRGKGFSLAPAASLVTGSASGRPLFDLIEEARDVVRALQFDPVSTEQSVNYVGIQLFQVETSAPVDAYQARFKLGGLLPAV